MLLSSLLLPLLLLLWCCCIVVHGDNFETRVGSPEVLFKFDKSTCGGNGEAFPSTGADDTYSLIGNSGTSCPDSHGVSLDGTIGSLTSNKDMTVFLGAAGASSGDLTIELWLRGSAEDTTGTSTLFTIGVGSEDCDTRDLSIKTKRAGGIHDARLQLHSINIDPEEAFIPSCDDHSPTNADPILMGGKLYQVVLVYTSSSVEVFIDGLKKGSKDVKFTTAWFRDDKFFHIGFPQDVERPDHSWSGTIHLFAMYNKALTTEEVEKNYAAYLPDSMPVVRDVSFTVIEDELTPIQFSVGEDGGTFFDFDDEHRPIHSFEVGEGFTDADKATARSELCINSLPTDMEGTLWVNGFQITKDTAEDQFPYPIGTTKDIEEKKVTVEYQTAKDGNNNSDGYYAKFKLCARVSGSLTCTSSTNSEGEEETDTSTVTISVTAVNDPPTVADMAEEVYAEKGLVIKLEAKDVEDDNAHVAVMITRLPENIVPNAKTGGKLYEVSSAGGTGCDTSKPVVLDGNNEFELKGLQVCYLYDGSINGAGAVVAEVEFEYRAIDSEGATSKGSEDGVVSVKVKNQLEPTPAKQWAFEDGIIPEDPALRPTRDFVDPGVGGVVKLPLQKELPHVEGMNLLQLKGEDRSSEDRAFKYFISSLPSHGKLFDVAEATKGISEGGVRKAISIDGVVEGTEKKGFQLTSEEGYVYYQPKPDYFNTRFMVNGEPEDKELGMAPDTFEFGLLIQDEDGKIKSISGTATHSVKVSNVHDPAIVTVTGNGHYESTPGVARLTVTDWVTVETPDEEGGAEGGAYSWDRYRLTVECDGDDAIHGLNWNGFRTQDGATSCVSWYWDWSEDTENKSCLEAPLHVLRLAMDPLVFIKQMDADEPDTTCKVAVVAVHPDTCGTRARNDCLKPVDYSSITVTFPEAEPEAVPPGDKLVLGMMTKESFYNTIGAALGVLSLIVVGVLIWNHYYPKPPAGGRKKNPRNRSKSSESGASLSFAAENTSLAFVGRPPSYDEANQMEAGGSSDSRWNEDSSSRRKEEMQRWASASVGSVNYEGGGGGGRSCDGSGKKKPRSFRPLTMAPALLPPTAPSMVMYEQEHDE